MNDNENLFRLYLFMKKYKELEGVDPFDIGETSERQDGLEKLISDLYVQRILESVFDEPKKKKIKPSLSIPNIKLPPNIFDKLKTPSERKLIIKQPAPVKQNPLAPRRTVPLNSLKRNKPPLFNPIIRKLIFVAEEPKEEPKVEEPDVVETEAIEVDELPTEALEVKEREGFTWSTFDYQRLYEENKKAILFIIWSWSLIMTTIFLYLIFL